MTHGDMWLAKAHLRIEGWCKTRGWRVSFPRLTTPRYVQWRGYSQYEVFITDRSGRVASIAFNMHADKANLVNEGGLGQGFDAVTFDNMLEPFELAKKTKPSKHQMELRLC